MRQLFLEALAGKNRSRPPVWLMRQAGRYMPSYQKLRERHALIEMFTDPDLIQEVTLQPIQAFDMDAAIIFSDILLLLDVMGLDVSYKQGVGIGSPLKGFDDPRLNLSQAHLEEKMSYLPKSIRAVKKELSVPLIGFVAAPWTLACYAWESKEAATATGLHGAFWKDTLGAMKMMKKFQFALTNLALMQIKAGVDVIQIFDSHSHLLSPLEYHQWVLKPVSEMIQTLGEKVPVIYFTRASSLFAKDLIQLPPCCLGIDWQSDIETFRLLTTRALQGAFNPWQLLSSPETWRPELKSLLNLRKKDPAYICGLGHGVLPTTPVDHVRQFVEEVRSVDWV
jgi:uroporphyrinogen decarboxylase